MQSCPSCGSSNDPGEEVCFKCGKGLSAIVEGMLVGGRYEILSRLGRGGMGVVYRAHDHELDEVVALKALRPDATSPELTRRFRSEIKLARRVTHRNVCRIHEFGRDGNVAYIVMELVEGVDFKQILHQKGPLAAEDAYDTSVQIAEGLHEIHQAGIIHRDLKTTNIMRDGRGVVKLMDFGIAKSFESVTTGATATGQIVGTPEYMSPEQARAGVIDLRSDIYALGIVVFELFTAQVPFRGDTPVATLFKQIQELPPLQAPRLPSALRPVLHRALAKTPDDRFGSAREFAEELRSARATTGLAVSKFAFSRMSVAPAPHLEPETTPMPTPVPTPVPASPTERLQRCAGRSRNAVYGLIAAATGVAIVASAGAILFPPREVVGEKTADTLSPGSPPSSLPALRAPAERVANGTLTATPRRLEVTTGPDTRPSAAAAAATSESIAPAPGNRGNPTTASSRAAASGVPSMAPTLPAPLAKQRASTSSSAEQAAAGSPLFEPSMAPLAVEQGTLQVVVFPWAEVEVDGVKVGVSPPLKPLKVAAGVRVVRLIHPSYLPFQRKLTVHSGETTRFQVDLTKDAFPK